MRKNPHHRTARARKSPTVVQDREKKWRKAQLTVLLVYPNIFEIAMDNLGFQGMYRAFSLCPGVYCERAFFNKERRICSFETGRPASSFDVIAFSISFENDYVNVLQLLKLAGIEPRASRRRGRPFLLAGGVGAFINPEPITVFMDGIFLGEGEEALPEIVGALSNARARGIEAMREAVCAVEGMYVPSHHSPFLKSRASSRPYKSLRRRTVGSLTSTFVSSTISTPTSHFGGMFLVEVARGCSGSCRFCAVSSVYAPLRFVPLEPLIARIAAHAPARGTIGLIGACVGDYPQLAELLTELVGTGRRISLSSLRADAANFDVLKLVARSGTKSITIAPEAGTARLRKVIGKELDEQALLSVADCSARSGLSSLKLYFMVGLPGEREEDIHAIISVTDRVRSAFSRGTKHGLVTVSVSPFVPKAFTPFQWCGMEARDSLRRKVNILRQGFAGKKGVRFKAQGLQSAILEAALSRGRYKTGEALYHVVFDSLALTKAWERVGLDIEHDVFGWRELEEPLPWDHLDIGPPKEKLAAEFRRAQKEGGFS